MKQNNKQFIRGKERPDLSFILPVFGNAQSLMPLTREIRLCCQHVKLQFEIILVDDCSNDCSWQNIHRLCNEYPLVRGFRFEENYGQHTAVLYGLLMADSDNYIVMDADMQDHPEHITKLLKEQVRTGAEVVFAGRTGSYQSWDRMITSRLYRILLLEKVAGLPRDAGMYFLITQRGRYRILFSQFNGPPMVIGMIASLDISCTSIPVRRRKRALGTSCYTFNKRISSAVRMVRCARSNHNSSNIPVIGYLNTLKVEKCIL
jgi:glycosyltransferase involved in cell wall biosynthesis